MWLAVEIAASETLAESGIVPEEAARAIREKGDFSVVRIQEIEAEVKHDIIAITTAVAETIGLIEVASLWSDFKRCRRYAQALQVKAASTILRAGLTGLADVLRKRAIEFKQSHHR